MASIPPIAYIIIGVVMSALSKFVEATSGSKSLTLFFYIGIIFVFVGIAKMVMASMKDEAKTKHHQHHLQTQQRQQPQHTRMHEIRGQHTISQHNPSQHTITCMRCGTRHYAFARFCMNCGQQLRMH